MSWESLQAPRSRPLSPLLPSQRTGGLAAVGGELDKHTFANRDCAAGYA